MIRSWLAPNTSKGISHFGGRQLLQKVQLSTVRLLRLQELYERTSSYNGQIR
jgi:hypothetical protein